MIFDLLTTNQWTVIAIGLWVIFWVASEVVLAVWYPWKTRTFNDAPPILGGMLFGALGVGAVWAILALIHGLTWLWQN